MTSTSNWFRFAEAGDLTELVSFANRNNQTVDINMCDSNGDSALTIASGKGNIEVVEYLLKNNADIEQRNVSGRTALILACRNAKIDVLRCLLSMKECYIDAQDILGCTALIYSSSKGFVDIVNVLVSSGASLNIQDNVCALFSLYYHILLLLNVSIICIELQLGSKHCFNMRGK